MIGKHHANRGFYFSIYISSRYKNQPNHVGGNLPMHHFFFGGFLPIDPIHKYPNTLKLRDKLSLFKGITANVQLFHFFVQGATRNVEFVHYCFDVAVMARQCIADDVLFEMAKLICE